MSKPLDEAGIGQTRVHCFECNTSHRAAVRREGASVVGCIDCPNGERSVTLSTDAEVFMDLRSKATRVHARDRAKAFRPLINLLSITDQCNCECPVCYAAAGPTDNPTHLPIVEIARRGREMRQAGARQVSLTGGEPTLHPDLPAVVRELRKSGLRVLIATNGLRLAESLEYVRLLKKSGLWKVNLQFDTLDESIHEQLRGNRRVDAKIQAAHNVIAAGLRLGTITTVNTLNLADVRRIVEFGLSLELSSLSMVFQAASTAGRYGLPEDTLVDREQIIAELLQCEALAGVDLSDVWPLPSYRPWSLRVHPDCAANLVLLRDGARVCPLTHAVNVERLYRKLSANSMRPSWIARNLVPLAYILSTVRRGKVALLLKSLSGFLGNSRRSGITIIGVGSFLSDMFWDEARIADCATVEWTDGGPVSPCVNYSKWKGRDFREVRTR